MEKVKVLGIDMFAGNIEDATQIVLQGCREEQASNHRISATGAHGLVFAKKNEEFSEVLETFFLNLPDGMPSVWVGRLMGARKMRRCYGPEFFASIMKSSAGLPIGHFFCGGNEGVAEELCQAVADKFNNSQVLGTYCPPFLNVDDYDYKSIAKQIGDTEAKIVWIGLSTPKQEVFARNLARYTHVHFIITVGAAFDFHTGKVRQAPPLIQKSGLEWLFRLTMEPKRLYKRYLEVVPSFIYYNFKEMFTFALRNKI